MENEKMQFMLENKRLAMCAELLRGGAVLNKAVSERKAADIGTDHGYLAVYLVDSGICSSAVAADINVLPLKSAERTISENGLSDRITTVLSDGLDNVSPDGITDIICAGMGGELIADIIFRHDWARQANLILQPMTKADELRRRLFDGGFFIEKERACHDGRFVYAVMRAVYAPDRIDYPCSERYLAAGMVKADGGDGSEYLKITAQRLKRAAEGMLKSEDESKREKAKSQLSLAQLLLKESGE